MGQRYPPDEFDRVAQLARRRGRRRGAHRARQSPFHALLPTVLVLAAVAAVVAGVTLLLSSGPPESAATPEASATGSEPVTPPTSPEGVTTGGRGPTEGGVATDDGAAGATGTSAGANGDVDHAVPVRVVNATSASGLAASVAQTLIQQGWDVSGLANRSEPAEITTIYYGTSDLRPSAQGVARDLGAWRTRLDSQLGESITVVVGSDLEG